MKNRGLRPSLERKLQEYLIRRKEFEHFVRLEHQLLKLAFEAGRKFGSFDEWRDSFAKEYQKAREKDGWQ